jgi:hypothetical protein
MVQGATRKLLNDITDDEALVTIGESPNHICWQTGHIITTTAHRIGCQGAKADIPKEWVRLFARGAENKGDRAAFPVYSELRTMLFSLYAQADASLAACTEEYLNSEIEMIPGWKDLAAHYITFLLTHDFYHAGQVAIIRRHLGRSGTFG